MTLASSSTEKRLQNRLSRAEGQLRGVQRMLEEQRPCEEVVTQLLAVRSAVDETVRVILTERVTECMQTLEPDEAQAAVSRALALLARG